MQARPGPVLPLVDFTASPALSIRAGGRAEYLPLCNGSVDCLAARPCPWPELAAASKLACRFHVYEGRT